MFKSERRDLEELTKLIKHVRRRLMQCHHFNKRAKRIERLLTALEKEESEAYESFGRLLTIVLRAMESA